MVTKNHRNFCLFFVFIMNSEWLDTKLLSRVEEYCKENGFDFAERVNTYIRDGFTKERFGEVPPFFEKEAQQVPEEKPLVVNRYTMKVEARKLVRKTKPESTADTSESEQKPAKRRKLNVK